MVVVVVGGRNFGGWYKQKRNSDFSCAVVGRADNKMGVSVRLVTRLILGNSRRLFDFLFVASTPRPLLNVCRRVRRMEV